MPKKTKPKTKKTKNVKPAKKIEMPVKKKNLIEDEDEMPKMPSIGNKDVGIRMKVCEVCGDESADVVACRSCGIHFCGECGYTEKHLCFDCGEGEEETQEDEADETLVESSEVAGEELEGLDEE